MGYYDDYLEHHGIKGQKWGVRRFENKNGRLTAAGKARYDGDKVSKKEQRAAYNKRYDEWSSKQDANDAEFRRVQELRKGLGKTGLTRTINAARNKSDAAKEYNKAYDKWSSKQDKLDKEWRSVKASKPGLTDKQKKMIVAGAAIAGTALAAYGGYKLHQLNNKPKTSLPETSKALDKAQSALKEFQSLQSNPNKPTFSKPAQNGASSRKQEQDKIRAIEQNLLKARQESLRRSGQSASKVVKINGPQKFSQAAKANDDYVSQMLKKNARNLSQYTMKDLRDLDLY